MVCGSEELPYDIAELWPRLMKSAEATGVYPHLCRPDDPFFLQDLKDVDAVRLESVLAPDFAEYRRRPARGHRALAARPGSAVRELARTGGGRGEQHGRSET